MVLPDSFARVLTRPAYYGSKRVALVSPQELHAQRRCFSGRRVSSVRCCCVRVNVLRRGVPQLHFLHTFAIVVGFLGIVGGVDE